MVKSHALSRQQIMKVFMENAALLFFFDKCRAFCPSLRNENTDTGLPRRNCSRNLRE
jgi:hypothetical protein